MLLPLALSLSLCVTPQDSAGVASPSAPGKPVPQVARPSGSSSSRDSIIDLSPPGNDADHPGSDEAEESVSDFKPYDPHKADKDVEVGKYYASQKNYKAAISRFREALEYKPRDAEATFFLADSLERAGSPEEAAKLYQEYLKILRDGPYSVEARRRLERLRGAKPGQAKPDAGKSKS